MFTACLAHLQKKGDGWLFLPLHWLCRVPSPSAPNCGNAHLLLFFGPLACVETHTGLYLKAALRPADCYHLVLCAETFRGGWRALFFFFFLLAGGSYRVSVSRSSSSPSFRPSVVCKKKGICKIFTNHRPPQFAVVCFVFNFYLHV